MAIEQSPLESVTTTTSCSIKQGIVTIDLSTATTPTTPSTTTQQTLIETLLSK